MTREEALIIIKNYDIPLRQAHYGYCPLCKETVNGKHGPECEYVAALKMVGQPVHDLREHGRYTPQEERKA